MRGLSEKAALGAGSRLFVTPRCATIIVKGRGGIPRWKKEFVRAREFVNRVLCVWPTLDHLKAQGARLILQNRLEMWQGHGRQPSRPRCSPVVAM